MIYLTIATSLNIMKISTADGSLYSFQISGLTWKEINWKFLFNSDETSLYFTARFSSNKILKYL